MQALRQKAPYCQWQQLPAHLWQLRCLLAQEQERLQQRPCALALWETWVSARSPGRMQGAHLQRAWSCLRKAQIEASDICAHLQQHAWMVPELSLYYEVAMDTSHAICAALPGLIVSHDSKSNQVSA